MTLDKFHKEARKIIENNICKKLTINDIVHHKDGNKKNNDINNLLLTTKEDHTRIHNPSKGKKHKKQSWNKLNDDMINKIIELKKNNLNNLEISLILGISDMTVKRYVVEYKSLINQTQKGWCTGLT